jgi:AhpD family alkylhydroperoxidase
VTAGRLQGYGDDAIWFEAAYAVGVTNGLNALADGARVPLDFTEAGSRKPLLPLADVDGAAEGLRELLAEIAAFYGMPAAPNVFRLLAADPGYCGDYWQAVKFAFSDRHLDRLTKEVMALGASVAAKSDYGVDLHLREVRRLGLSERGILEALEVVQLFSAYTKIADLLMLEPEFGPAREGPHRGARGAG